MDDFLVDEQFLKAIIAMAQSAQYSIYISTFKAEITTKRRGARLKELFDVLVEKARQGKDVRILMNKRDNRGHIPEANAYALRFLGPTKVKIRHLPGERLCHAKIFIVDEITAICGSHNLSVRSCHNNFEVSCRIREYGRVEQLVDVYEWQWQNATKG